MTTIWASLTTFAATNIDDICLVTLFFARRVPTHRVVAGQYLGFSVIILFSCLGSFLTLAIPTRSIRLLGFLPLSLGVKELIERQRSEHTEQPPEKRLSVVSIAAITVSNGADNVGVYIPFFRFNSGHLWPILTVYGVLLGIWCFAARLLGGHPAILRAVDRAGHWLVPFVFITLGLYIVCSASRIS